MLVQILSRIFLCVAILPAINSESLPKTTWSNASGITTLSGNLPTCPGDCTVSFAAGGFNFWPTVFSQTICWILWTYGGIRYMALALFYISSMYLVPL